MYVVNIYTRILLNDAIKERRQSSSKENENAIVKM